MFVNAPTDVELPSLSSVFVWFGPALASGTSLLSDTLPFAASALAANALYPTDVTTRAPSVVVRAGVSHFSAFQWSRSSRSVSRPAASRMSSFASSSVCSSVRVELDTTDTPFDRRVVSVIGPALAAARLKTRARS
jgi:hypothetical protein